MTPNILTYF